MLSEKKRREKRTWDFNKMEKDEYEKIINGQRGHIKLLEEKENELLKKLSQFEGERKQVLDALYNAQKSYEEIVEEAKIKAQAIVCDAQNKKRAYDEKLNECEKQYVCLKLRLQSMAQDILNSTDEKTQTKKTV